MAYAGHLFCEADAGRGKGKMNGLPQYSVFSEKSWPNWAVWGKTRIGQSQIELRLGRTYFRIFIQKATTR